MATKKKITAEQTTTNTEPAVNNKQKYVVIEPLRGLINKQQFVGNIGDIVEMEPWQARLLKTYVKEEQT